MYLKKRRKIIMVKSFPYKSKRNIYQFLNILEKNRVSNSLLIADLVLFKQMDQKKKAYKPQKDPANNQNYRLL